MDNVEFIAQCKRSQQITEDHWIVETPTLRLTDKTTVGERYAWYRKQLPLGFAELTIIQIQP